jgi:lysophospholipase L1-like esterase
MACDTGHFVRLLWVACLGGLMLLYPLSGRAGQPATKTVVNPAIVPQDRLQEVWWAQRHQAVLEAVHQHPETALLMIGDSITNDFDKDEPPDQDLQPIWQQFYAPRHALNLGFSGDTTAHVLWRLDHGEVEGLHPQAAVLLIGTNNTGTFNETAEQTEAGIDAVIGALEQKLPATKIMLLGILPSGLAEDKVARDRKVNEYLAACYSEDPRVSYLDLGSLFYKNGALNQGLFYDPRMPWHGSALHLDTVGHRMMAEAIEPALAELMGDTPRIPLASMAEINTALIPVPRLELDSYDWYARHHAELMIGKQLNPQIVMIGDSITHFWGGAPRAHPINGPESWDHIFGGKPVLNMGFGWDRTQNVLWRIRQGEFDGLSPQWIVLEIGTNNLTASKHARENTPEEIAAAIAEICRQLQKRSPQSRIVLMGIFPRWANPKDPIRTSIAKTNALLAQEFQNDVNVRFLDIGARFLQPDGTLPTSIMPDGTHPSEAGYRIWTDALLEAGVGANGNVQP